MKDKIHLVTELCQRWEVSPRAFRAWPLAWSSHCRNCEAKGSALGGVALGLPLRLLSSVNHLGEQQQVRPHTAA